MNFKVEWLEGYGDVKPRICTMENFVSEEFNLEAYWGEDGMIEKLRELLTSKVGQKVTLANGMGEHVVATRVATVQDNEAYWHKGEDEVKRRKALAISLGERTGHDIHWTQVVEDKHCVYYHNWEYPDDVEVYHKPLPTCAEPWIDILYEDSAFLYQGAELPEHLKERTAKRVQEYKEYEKECEDA